MIPQWWSIALTVIGVSGVLCVALKRWYGFVIGVGVQVLWVIYAVTTRQWGFIGSAVAYGIVNGLGWYRWARDRRKGGTGPLRGLHGHHSAGVTVPIVPFRVVWNGEPMDFYTLPQNEERSKAILEETARRMGYGTGSTSES